MRVLQINSVCGVGSTGKICQDLYWELKRRGYECKIAWGRRKGGNVPDEDTIQIGMPIDYYWHALSTRIFDNTGFCSKRATEKFIEEVKIYNPDVIHLHNIHGYYINISVLFDYLRKCGKKSFGHFTIAGVLLDIVPTWILLVVINGKNNVLIAHRRNIILKVIYLIEVD